MFPLRSLLRIVHHVESGAACSLGEITGVMGVAEMLLELVPVLVYGCLVAPLRAGLVDLLGVGDGLEGDADDSFVQHVVIDCLGVGSLVLNLSHQVHEGELHTHGCVIFSTLASIILGLIIPYLSQIWERRSSVANLAYPSLECLGSATELSSTAPRSWCLIEASVSVYSRKKQTSSL